MPDRTPTRRHFLAFGSMASLIAWSLPAMAGAPQEIVITNFDVAGKNAGTARVAKLVKSDTEWQRQLSPEQFHVTRQAGTEQAFTGATWNNNCIFGPWNWRS